MLKIDKGVPVPAYSQGNNGYGETIVAMSEGDSVFFPAGDEKKAKGFARRIRDMGFTTRMVKVVEKDPETGADRRGTRVWKEKPKTP